MAKPKKKEKILYPKPFFSFESKSGTRTIDFYLLDVGQCVEGFGGSQSPLCAVKTASVVIKDHSVGGAFDYEYSLNDPRVWDWLYRLTQNEQITAVVPPVEDNCRDESD